MTRLALSLASALLLSVLRVSPVRAQAQPDDTGAYGRAITAALEEYELSHFEEARSLFQQAHALDANARTLRGLGMVEFELRHYLVAAQLLEQALDSTHKPLTSEQRVLVQQLLERTRQFIAHVRLVVTPSTEVVVELDGAQLVLDAQQRFSTHAGEHVLRVSAPGFVLREQRLDARGGEQTVTVQLTPTEPSAERAPAPRPLRTERIRPHRKLGIALASGGAALIGAGSVLGALALSRAERSEQRDDRDAEQAHRLAVGTDVLLSVGIAGALVGTICLLYGRDVPVRTGARVDALFPALRVSF